MISARIENLPALKAALGGYAGQIDYAKALALHRTAHIARRDGIAEMRAQFDSPTPSTLNSLFVLPRKPDKKNPTCYLLVKDVAFGTTLKDYSPSVPEPGSMAEQIGHQFSGGGRVRKKLEKGLERGGYITSGEYVAPGPDAPLNQYGNVTPGFVLQVLSALAVQRDAANNATSSRRSRRNAKKAGNVFWSFGGTQQGGLRRGLWSRDADGSPLLLLVVIGPPKYTRRIDLEGIADAAVARNFNEQFRVALDKAIATARS